MNFLRPFFLLLICIFSLTNVYANLSSVHEERIVTLAPSLTEIVYALGLGKELVGDTLQCDYPLPAKKISKVGDYINPNIEKILQQKPTIVLATIGNPISILNKLEINVNSPLGILLQEMSKGIVRYNVSFSPAFYIY